eukprot:TRINITY_DN920_c0_g1_i1.p1 TRINITY_DN920_c0_g1~~TRINITY_DN920_c0_g1_i1.p1  ORF type:complete len:249 (+),score=72.29 TRINITY_DN920_c0_g1_i1:51-797(+)
MSNPFEGIINNVAHGLHNRFLVATDEGAFFYHNNNGSIKMEAPLHPSLTEPVSCLCYSFDYEYIFCCTVAGKIFIYDKAARFLAAFEQLIYGTSVIFDELYNIYVGDRFGTLHYLKFDLKEKTISMGANCLQVSDFKLEKIEILKSDGQLEVFVLDSMDNLYMNEQDKIEFELLTKSEEQKILDICSLKDKTRTDLFFLRGNSVFKHSLGCDFEDSSCIYDGCDVVAIDSGVINVFAVDSACNTSTII